MAPQFHITINSCSLGYGGTELLQLNNLRFEAGDFVAVVGLNGSGKSTLLKSVCGLLPVMRGGVEINGLPLNELPLAELARLVAIVLTEKIQGFNLTAFDAVAAGQMPYTNAFHQLEEKHLLLIREAMAAAGIAAHAHKPLQELSDGLFQKTMIAKALAQQTPCVLLDEPTAFLDFASKHDLFLLLKKLSQEGKCVLVSTHDLDLVKKYCAEVLVVANGGAQLMDVAQALHDADFKTLGGGYI